MERTIARLETCRRLLVRHERFLTTCRAVFLIAPVLVLLRHSWIFCIDYSLKIEGLARALRERQ